MTHILLIEDNPGDARLIQELLYETDTVTSVHHITHVERISEALGVLQDGRTNVDVILSDISLPDSAGLDTLTALSAAGAELPVIFMTGTNDERLALTAIHQGAQDYIIKGHHDGDTLARAIKYAAERKKFQKELDEVRSKEQTNQERIRLLAQEKRQLLVLSKAKDEFISLASHQLRTPASAVKQYLGMIIEGYLGDVDEKVLNSVQSAFNSNERQLQVINDLLKTARLDADSYHLRLARQDIKRLLGEVISGLQPSLELHEQSVSFTSNDRPLMANFDYGELCLVFENILNNASKYSPNGKIIAVAARRSGKWAEVTITDQGVGIGKTDQKKVFDKFTRVDNPLSDTVSGNGLGLYWVKRIVKLHHGKIGLKSEPGKGTEFTVSIPL